MNNCCTYEILAEIFRTAGVKLSVSEVLEEHKDVKIIKKYVDIWFSREDGVAIMTVDYNNETYKTILRGRHQALNIVYLLEVIKLLRQKGIKITREHIDKVLMSVHLEGHFETINSKPMVIFDKVESDDDAKNFCTAVDDYFGRSVQRSMITRENLHPEPIKKLIIADTFFPSLTGVKQSTTIIFTAPELRDQYISVYSGIVKTLVLPLGKALNEHLKQFNGYKVFVVGNEETYKNAKSLCKGLNI